MSGNVNDRFFDPEDYQAEARLGGAKPKPAFETFMEDVFKPAVVGYSAPEPKDEDPFQSAEYAKFVSSMVPHCHCRANNCPCDGVLAGGPCDMVQEEEPQERMEDEDEDQP